MYNTVARQEFNMTKAEELYSSKMDSLMERVLEGEFSDAYEAYIYKLWQTPIGKGRMLVEALESGNYLEEFCQSILINTMLKEARLDQKVTSSAKSK